MATKRLTNVMRKEIVGNVVTKTFKGREEACTLLGLRIFGEIYDVTVPDDFMEIAKKHPEWFPEAHQVQVYKVDKDGDRRTVKHFSDAPKRVPQSMKHPWTSGTYSVNIAGLPEDLKQEIDNYIAEDRKICGERKSLADKVKAIVKSVTTVNKLMEAWPEVTKYYDFNLSPNNLPVVCAKEVNEMIGKFATAA